MTGTLQLSAASSTETALTVPLTAIVKAPAGQGEFAEYTLTPGASGDAVAHLVPVSVGETLGNNVIIRGGLAQGQRVITSGTPLLRDGQPVRVTP